MAAAETAGNDDGELHRLLDDVRRIVDGLGELTHLAVEGTKGLAPHVAWYLDDEEKQLLEYMRVAVQIARTDRNFGGLLPVQFVERVIALIERRRGAR